MDLRLTEEQAWLGEAVGDLISRQSGDGGLVPADRAQALWSGLVEFGALEVGGEEGLGAVELALVARALGTHLAPVPYAESASLRYALGRSGAADIGAVVAALAFAEPGRSFAPADPATTLDSGRLFGEKDGVAFAATAEVLAVPAAAPDGLVLALVPGGASDMTFETAPTLDPSLAPAAVRLDGVVALTTVRDPDAPPLVDALAAVAGILVSAEAVGAAAAVLSLARDYAAQRRQFGRTIGSFQAIRHLLADMVVRVESSWSSVLYAAASVDEDEPGSLRTASIAKAYAARATHEVAHSALQVFGGIAFTAEHPAHRYLRRIVARGDQLGTARDHERRLGRDLARQLEVLT